MNKADKQKAFFALVIAIVLAVISLAIFSCVNTGEKNAAQAPAFAPQAPNAASDTVPAGHFCRSIDGRETGRAVGAKGKFWTNGQTLKIGFTGGTAAQRKFVTDAFAEWSKYANLNFAYPSSGPYDCRVTFDPGSGSWSYVGTDCKSVPQNRATMNIGWSGLDVCLHEIGHFLGLLHEHQNPTGAPSWNRERVIKDLSGPPNSWTVAMIESNVLNPAPAENVIATALDPVSIMMYSIPGTWTCDGKGFPGGKVLSAADRAFIAARYPKPAPPPVETVVISKADAALLLSVLRANAAAADTAVARFQKLTGQ